MKTIKTKLGECTKERNGSGWLLTFNEPVKMNGKLTTSTWWVSNEQLKILRKVK